MQQRHRCALGLFVRICGAIGAPLDVDQTLRLDKDRQFRFSIDGAIKILRSPSQCIELKC